VNRVSATPVGSEATVEVLRGGKRMEFKLAIGERNEVWAEDPRFSRFREPKPGEEPGSTQVKFGLQIQNLTPTWRDRRGFKESGGVLVAGIEPNSFADDIGLQANDVITAINRHPVNSVDDVKKIQATLKPGEPAAFRVLRGTRTARGDMSWLTLFVAGTLPANP